MRIVIGRGNKRQELELPCGSIIKRLDEAQVKEGHANLCRLLKVPL